MQPNNDIITTCKDNRDKYLRFKRYNTPAIIFVLVAIIIPLALLIPTSSHDPKGNLDLSTSPYVAYAGIIFLVGIALAIIFSKIANIYKINITENFALYAFNVYENILEYDRSSSIKDYKVEATNAFTELISQLKTNLDGVDDKVKNMLPFISQIKDLPLHLEQSILPNIASDNQDVITTTKRYLLQLIEYFLHPSDVLLKELLLTEIPVVMNSHISSTPEVPAKRSILGIRSSRKTVIFTAFCGIGGLAYFLALSLGVDKNTAYLSGITLAGFIIAGYIAYLRK